MNVLKLWSISLLLLLIAIGCEKDDSEFIEIEFLKFSDFGCESDKQWYMNSGYQNENHIITSQNEFEKIVNIVCSPQIDFGNYTLLIGNRSFSYSSSLYNEKVEENNSTIVYTVTLREDDAAIPSWIFYHAIIEKPSSRKKIEIVEVVK